MRTVNEICNSLVHCAALTEKTQEGLPIGQEIRRCVDDLRVAERTMENNIWALQILLGKVPEKPDRPDYRCPCHGNHKEVKL